MSTKSTRILNAAAGVLLIAAGTYCLCDRDAAVLSARFLLGVFLLFNRWFTLVSLPFLLTLWLLFSGVSQFLSAFDLRALGVRAWD